MKTIMKHPDLPPEPWSLGPNGWLVDANGTKIAGWFGHGANDPLIRVLAAAPAALRTCEILCNPDNYKPSFDKWNEVCDAARAALDIAYPESKSLEKRLAEILLECYDTTKKWDMEFWDRVKDILTEARTTGLIK